jgi:hypothetical protein
LEGETRVKEETEKAFSAKTHPHGAATRMHSTGSRTSPGARPQYSIKVSAEAGIGKTDLDYLDIQALAWRVDYPE